MSVFDGRVPSMQTASCMRTASWRQRVSGDQCNQGIALEPHATTLIVRHLLETDLEKGLRLRVVRRRDGQEMETTSVDAVSPGSVTEGWR